MLKNKIEVIQGLRGISVILVMLFHLQPEYFRLGYLGVDIFFVISGFVITKSIIKDIRNDKFSFSNFYSRRFLRLFPALLVFITLSLTLILLLSIIDDNFISYLRTAILSLVGVSNFYLIKDGNDYFNPQDDNPYVHAWSLSVEEQFYLIFPIFLIFIYKFFKTNRLFVLTFVIFLSIILINLSGEKNIFTDFYSITSRFWELLIGCLTFFILESKEVNKKNVSLFYIIPLLFSIYLIDNINFKLILICIVTSIIITNYQKDNLLNNLIKNRMLLFFGNISYSLYLWHLPIIFLVNYYFINIEFFFLSILLSILAASLSYRYIESPFTNSKTLIISLGSFIRKYFFKALMPLLIIVLLSAALNLNKLKNFENNSLKYFSKINFNNNLINLENNEKDKFTFICHENHDSFLNNNFNKCNFKINSNNLVIFFGDSHTWNLAPFFKDFNLDTDIFISSFNSSSFVHPIIRKDDKIIKKLVDKVNLYSRSYKKIYLVISIDHLFSKKLSKEKNNFSKKIYENYNSLIKNNKMPFNVDVILLEDTPVASLDLNKCEMLKKINLSLFYKDKESICDYSYEKIIKDFRKLKIEFNNLQNENANFKLINTLDYFCAKQKCKFYDNKGNPIFYDKRHLSFNAAKEYAIFLEKKIRKAIQ